MGVIKFGFIGILLSFAYFLFVKKDSLISFVKAFDRTGNGYGARLACSAVFGSNRSLESVLSAELTFPPVKFGRKFTLDENARCIHVQAKWPWAAEGALACHRSHRLGCHLLAQNGISYDLPGISDEPNFEKAEWPIGDQQNQSRLKQAQARVDYESLERVVDEHFSNKQLHARALLLIVDGEIVYEKYGDGCNANTPLLGWSATKSVLSTLIGLRVRDGALQLKTSLASLLPDWQDVNGSNVPHLQPITVEQALQMRDGMDVDEKYAPGTPVTDMLFIDGSVDKLMNKAVISGLRPRGQGCFHYSSVTTNVLSKAFRNTFTTIERALAYPTEALFRPLGARSFRIEASADGTFVGSSFGWATARDWARLGLLYLYQGKWYKEGASSADPAQRTHQLLPQEWVSFSATPAPTSRGYYGAHFWLGGNNTSSDGDDVQSEQRRSECDALFPSRINPDRSWLRHSFPQGTFLMHGFEEQCVAINPERGVVLVRLGATKEVVLKWDKPKFYKEVFQAVKTH